MIMAKSGRLMAAMLMLTVAGGANAQISGRVNIIPKPALVVEKGGTLRLSSNVLVYSDKSFTDAASLFANQANLSVSTDKKGKAKAQVLFIEATAREIADSAGYKLVVTPQLAVVYARTKVGALYGASTLTQLSLTQKDMSAIPCVEITDHPRFGYRGMHFDVSRHFFPVSFIKRFIDLMALYKMNTFHWHLTDGAGWRLEIKKYPELTSKAAWRPLGAWTKWWPSKRRYSEEGNANAYGGYYTQNDAREVVAYAAKRGITVIPEIEMPGHSEEVLATYPNLSCTGKPYESSEFCIGNDSTFTFLQDVLTEVMAIFPSKYIHVGGDEANKEHWKKCPKCQNRIKDNGLKDELELQSYLIRRMETFLKSKGRRLLGWDEILEGGLAPEATVMSWRGEQGGIDAANMGHDVIMTPGGYCYFDSYQADPATQPLAIGGFLPIKKVYAYEPIPSMIDSAKAKHVLGAQACLWTEYIPTTEHLEHMAFPRMLALSEVVWTQRANRSWDDFKQRLQAHYLLLQRLNVSYCRPSYKLDIVPKFDYEAKKVSVTLVSEQLNPTIYYTTDGSLPTTASNLYKGTFELSGSAKICAAIIENGEMVAKPDMLEVDFHKAIGRPVVYNSPYSANKYPAQKEATLVNGYRGSLSYGDGQWQGFEGGDMDVTIDLGNATELNHLGASFMQQIGPGVYMPDSVVVSLSDDGKNFREVKTVLNDISATETSLTFKTFQVDLKGETARYVRVFAKNGKRGFLFADEVVIY